MGDSYRCNRRHLHKSTSVANEGSTVNRFVVETDVTSEVSDGPSHSSYLKSPANNTARSADLQELNRAVTQPMPTAQSVTHV